MAEDTEDWFERALKENADEIAEEQQEPSSMPDDRDRVEADPDGETGLSSSAESFGTPSIIKYSNN